MKPQFASDRWLIVIYSATVFLSAFLLFQVQPLIGKFILPWFGGSPAVWTTCMLVFQLLLFAGYAYAHLTTQYLSPKQQALTHILLLLAAICTLPIAPDPSWKPTDSTWPALRIMLLTTACVGLPYFILSSTGPLVQGWFSRTHAGLSPYRLYALSNVGSLLALISYPFVIEPMFATIFQATIWSCLFIVFALLCGSIAYIVYRASLVSPMAAANQLAQTNAATLECPTWGIASLWFGLAMTPSVMLLATTNQVCLDVAVIPFLWVIPLALYLVTFILCFDSQRWYSRRAFLIGASALLFTTVYLMTKGSNVSLIVQVTVYFAALFCCCMVCHGELVTLKPHPRYLTSFFLTISAGGACGGVFVAVVAPLLFVSYFELQFGIVAFILLYLCLRLREDNMRWPLPAWSLPLAAPTVMLVVLVVLAQLNRKLEGYRAVVRNFYGVLRVEQIANQANGQSMLRMVHGRIEHGSQFTEPDQQRIATTYYSPAAAIGQLMQGFRHDRPRRIGIIGLGVGTLTAYGKPDDSFKLYEINPDVVKLADSQFSFLKNCPSEKTLVIGDARLTLEHEPAQHFDILVLDAFSGDAIPVHLLTKEAFAVYLKHLQPDGVLACHISNLHFDLQPVVRGLAQEFKFSCLARTSPPNLQTAALPAVWMLLARDSATLTSAVGAKNQLDQTKKPIVWTDDHSNLFEVLW